MHRVLAAIIFNFHMFIFTPAQQRHALLWLTLFHILIITASNWLVRYPFVVFGVHTTWAALSYPFTFLTTDLTVRIFGAPHARRIILSAMLPGLLFSYLLSIVSHTPLVLFDSVAARIALASLSAYAAGQLLDVFVFNRLRQLKQWWPAPAASTVLGNALDTLIFFSVAFYTSRDAFMAAHWPEIAAVDYGCKLAISGLLFLPAYGVLLGVLTRRLTHTQAQRRRAAALAPRFATSVPD